MDSQIYEEYVWLLSDAASSLLAAAQDAFLNRTNPVRIAKTLRKQTTATRAAMVMDQAMLRIRAKAKFQLSDRMFFSGRGLEQSTSEDLARYKSTRFDGLGSVIDVCCGIGGDLLGLIQRKSAQMTVGIDSDSITALFAEYNAKLMLGSSTQRIEVRAGNFSDVDLDEFEAVHCDPDRRTSKRTVVGSRFSPPLEEVLSRVGSTKNLAVKVAPATSISTDLPRDIEREWIGNRRECKQQVLWYGCQSPRPGNRTATMVDRDRVHQISVPPEEMETTVDVANQLFRYLYEPHPTVLAAGLTDVLARRCGLDRMAIDIDYLTSTRPINHPLLSRFEIVAAFPLDMRQTFEFLKHRAVGQIELKKRGVGNIVFDQFERMKISGPNRATVILTRIGSRRLVAIARRNPGDFAD